MTSQAPRTLGFLFADLRGYSAFVETHGDDAGAQLLRAYRDLVREQVARFDGAEIRTEGDSFYVVFPSASDAVRCGLAILEGASASTAAAGTAIRVGIGVHAGETTATDEGYVGSAVNIAARVCSMARPGELLVTDTVRSIVRSRLSAVFRPRGTRRLKGIREPIRLFAVQQAERARREASGRDPIRAGVSRPARLLAISAAGVIVLVVGVVVVGALADRNAESGSSDSVPPSGAASPVSSKEVGAPNQSEPADPYPNQAERDLLAAIHPDLRSRCRRGDPSEAPALEYGPNLRHPLRALAGLRCTAAGPAVINFWHAQYPEQTTQVFFEVQGRYAIPEGDCATESKAYMRWTYGDVTGLLLCRLDNEGARLVWTYGDRGVLGTARRADGDVAALYAWWLEHGRTLR